MNDVTPLGPPGDLSTGHPLARARAIAPAIAAAADTIERTQRIPPHILDALHEARLFRMLYPRSVGGDEVEPGAYVLALEELARRRLGRLVRVDRQLDRADRGLYGPRGSADDLGRPARHRRLGPAQRVARGRGAGRLPGHRPLGFRQRLPAFELDGRAWLCRRA